MKEKKLNRTKLAQKLQVSKGYVTQLFNGDFDHKLSKLVELTLGLRESSFTTFCIYRKFHQGG